MQAIKIKKPKKSSDKHYVNNEEFLKSIILYKAKYKKCVDENLPLPQIPNDIGKCLFDISNKLSLRPNFINYTYREEMVSDGLENAMMCITNFDPEKTNNPFGYFTQVIFWAFVRRIQKEQKQQYIKHKVIEKTIMVDSGFSGNAFLGEASYLEKTTDYTNGFVERYETTMNKKKQALKKS